MKKFISVLICLAVLFGSVAAGVGSLTAGAYGSWQEAYKDFIINKGFLSYIQDYTGMNDERASQDSVSFALHDMDGDGIPEIIINDGLWYAASNEGFHFFKYKKSTIQDIGSEHSYGLSYMKGTEFNGFLSWFAHGGGYIWSYVSIGSDGQVETELLVSGTDMPLEGQEPDGTIRMTEKTDNEKLYKAYCTAANVDPDNPFEYSDDNDNIEALEFCSLSEINAMGWSAFCKKYGYTVTEKTVVKSGWEGAYLEELQKEKTDFYFPDAKCVLICDLFGDSKPEMIYPCSSDKEYNYDRCLKILSYNGSSVQSIYYDSTWFTYGGGGSENCFFVLDDGRFGTFYSMADDWSYCEYKILKANTNNISVEEEFSEYYSYDYDRGVENAEYKVNGKKVAKSEFNNKKTALKQGIKTVLTGDVSREDFINESQLKNAPGMTYDKAIKFLQGSSTTYETYKFSGEDKTVSTSVTEFSDLTETTDEDTGKSLSADRETASNNKLYIIIAVVSAVVVALVAALAVIALKSRKKNNPEPMTEERTDGAQRAQENLYGEYPAEPVDYQQPAPVNPPESKLIQYSCVEAGHGGQCAMCKLETDSLLYVSAAKGENRQSYNLCVNCATKIIQKFKSANSNQS